MKVFGLGFRVKGFSISGYGNFALVTSTSAFKLGMMKLHAAAVLIVARFWASHSVAISVKQGSYSSDFELVRGS